jgi:aspartyl-tRNA(Asn)/glutamyl-tRNA(Gln) amidotransferase subunit A
LFAFSSIERYHAQLTGGETSCVQAVQHYLEKINSSQKLNAWLEVFSEEALQKAADLDKQRNSGKPIRRLHGVVTGIKDVLCYKDHQVTAASRILENFTSIYSSTVVEKLLAEDAIIIGRLNCDEFAMGSTNEHSAWGPVLNPLDETRVPGGSSGGSAAALRAGHCMLSLGSDTGGSVRQPADFSGVIGIKPSYGRISRHGLIAYASSFDQVGIFGNNIPDIALLLEIISGKDEFDSTVSQQDVPAYSSMLKPERPFRFAWFPETLEHPALDKEIAGSIKSKLAELEEQGHQVAALSFELLDYIVPAYYILTTAEASSNLSRYDGIKYGFRSPVDTGDIKKLYKKTRTGGFGEEVKRRIMLGTFVLSSGYYDAYFTKAQKLRQLVLKKINAVFEDYDFIILPVSPVTAFRIGEKMKDPLSMYLADIYTVMANLAGCPAISLPLFHHSNGMPFSLQVMANSFDEVSLLQVSGLLLAMQAGKNQ